MSGNDHAEVAGLRCGWCDHEVVERRPAGLSHVRAISAPIDDVEYTRRVCQIIDAPHYVMSFRTSSAPTSSTTSPRSIGAGTHSPSLLGLLEFDFLMQRANALDVE